MTIFFVSSDDAATQANHAIALGMLEHSDQALFAHDATRARLHQVIEDGALEGVIFAMSHGSPDAIFDTNGEQALRTTDAATLNGFKIFSWACHTAKGIGQTFAANGSTWWGYDCAITAPDHRPPYSAVFRDLFMELKQVFPTGVDAATVSAVLAQVKNSCANAEAQLEQLGASDDADAMSIYSCCNQMWQHLCVWLAGNQEIIVHPEAPRSSIF